MKLTCTFYLLLISSSIAFSQYASLQVSNPHTTAWSDMGTIEDASLVIKPQGSYSLQDLELSFSSRGTQFALSESLEVTLYFSLPAGSYITDLWLWIDTLPVQALIVDRGKARATYDNIVKRIRKDPAILEYMYSDYYRLQIFPLVGNDFRKIRLSYSSPYKTSAVDSLSLLLPTWIMNSSKTTIEKLHLTVQKNQWRGDPKIQEIPSITFSPASDSLLGDIDTANISGELIRAVNSITLGFGDSFSTKNYFLEKFGDDISGTYNLRVFPHKNLGLQTNRKLLFLIDHDSLRNYVSKQQIHDDIVTSLKSKLTAADSFNLILSSKSGFVYADSHWVSADTNSIHTLIDKMLQDDVLDTVNLGSLIFEGLNFASANGKENTSIIVIASSHQYGSLSKSNTYYDSLAKGFNFDVPFYFLNYGNYNYDEWFSSGGTYYYGNQYLYRLIALNSKGDYWQYYYDYYYGPTLINSAIDEIRGFVEYIDVTTYMDNGFTYEKINSPASTKIPVYNYFSQSGKYSGSFPLIVEMSGTYRGNVYHKKISIPDSLTYQSDSTLNVYTAYQQIMQLRNDYTQASKDRIVELSMNNRILSEYTAFLALEPGQKLCDTCLGNNNNIVITFADEEKQLPTTYEVLQAYPNPFNPSTKLRIRLPQHVYAKDVTLQIFNVLGQLVRTIDASNLTSSSYKEIVWDGANNSGIRVASGVYLVVLSTPVQRHTLKLILMK